MTCDYCLYDDPVDGFHHIPDPEGIEGTAKILCSKERPMDDETKTTTTTTTPAPEPEPTPEPESTVTTTTTEPADDDEDEDA